MLDIEYDGLELLCTALVYPCTMMLESSKLHRCVVNSTLKYALYFLLQYI